MSPSKSKSVALLALMLGVTTMAAAETRAEPAPAAKASSASLLSASRKIALSEKLAPERPTLFLFFRPESAMEEALAAQLEKYCAGQAGLYWIHLKTGDEPLAKQWEVTQTPFALVYDRRGRQVAKTSDPDEIRKGLAEALGVHRIDWAAPDDPRMEQVDRLLGRGPKPAFAMTMSLKPEWLAPIVSVSRSAVFSPNYLDLRTHEMIGTWVSRLNECPYCLGSHASNLARAGQKVEDVELLAGGDIEKAAFTEKDRLLLDYVKALTLDPSKVTDKKVDGLRSAGYTDEQIFEASFVTAMFAFYNRMASAYGLDYPNGGWLPKEERLRRGAPLEFKPPAPRPPATAQPEQKSQ